MVVTPQNPSSKKVHADEKISTDWAFRWNLAIGDDLPGN